jgi:hypothetical protein
MNDSIIKNRIQKSVEAKKLLERLKWWNVFIYLLLYFTYY